MPRVTPQTVRIAPASFLLGAAVALLFVAFAHIFSRIVDVLLVFFLGILLAEAIRPLAGKLRTWGIPRGLSVLLIYLLLVLLFTGLGMLVFPPFYAQIRTLARQLPALFQVLQQAIPRLSQISQELGLAEQVRQLGGQLATLLTAQAGALAAVPLQLFTVLLGLVSVLVIAYFWLSATEALDRALVSRLPGYQATFLRSLATELSGRAGGWLRGQIALMFFVGVVTFVGLLVLGVPYPVALAVWASITEIIPIVGPFLGAIPAVLVAFTVSPWLALATAVLYLVIQQLEGNILVPKVMERAVGLHPLVVLLAVLVGGSLRGIIGIVVAVPLAAALQVIVERTLIPWLLARAAELPFESPAPASSLETPAATVASGEREVPG